MKLTLKIDIFVFNIGVSGYRDSTGDIPHIAIPTSQAPIIQIKHKIGKERYYKFKNLKDSDKACLQKMKCKLETTRTYLNTPSSI